MNLKELLEKRQAARDAIENIRNKLTEDDRTEMTPEETETWEQCNADFNTFTESIKRARQAEEMDRVLGLEPEDRGTETPGREDTAGDAGNAGEITPEIRALAFNGWSRAQFALNVTEEEEAAMDLVKLHPWQSELSFRLSRKIPRTQAECRGLVVGTDSAGGYLVPEDFMRELEQALLMFGGIRQTAGIIRTATGAAMPWPTSNDTGNKGAQVDEATEVGEADPTFDQVVFNAYKYTSKLVKVSYELMRDSAFDMPSYLGQALGERLGRIQNEKGTTGTGTNTPNGLVTASTLGYTAASATAITFDDMINLLHSVDAAYRGMPGAGFMFNDAVALKLRLLKNGDEDYIWTDGDVKTDRPDMILGKPLTLNNDMASALTAAAKPVLFGDLSKYRIREVEEIRMYRLEERFRTSDQDGFLAFMSFDSDLVDAGTHPVKYLQLAAGS